MYNELSEAITKKLKKIRNYVSYMDLEYSYIMLLYLKYLCDEQKYKYQDVIKEPNIEKYITEFVPMLRIVFNRFKDSELNKLLSFIEFEDLKKLIYDFIDNYKNNKLNLIDEYKNKIYVTNSYPIELYDVNGGVTYVNYDLDSVNHRKKEIFKILDKMLNNQNIYKEEIEKSDILEKTVIYIYDDILSYRYHQNKDILDYVYKYSKNYSDTKIILETKYRKIATLKYSFYYDNLRRIMMIKDMETVYLDYNDGDSDKISIIMYDNEKIKNIADLKKIILNDRKQKDVLVKVSKDEIEQNHGKIGFRIYQNKSDENRNINDIVNENSKIIDRLNSINNQIKVEIDKLINR